MFSKCVISSDQSFDLYDWWFVIICGFYVLDFVFFTQLYFCVNKLVLFVIHKYLRTSDVCF